MEYYRVHHQLGKFFETYYKLVDLLDRELNVRPSRVIEELYHSVLEAKRTHKQSNRVNVRELPFFGRKQELSQLEEYLSLVEKGEAVGLSWSWGNLEQAKNVYCVNWSCCPIVVLALSSWKAKSAVAKKKEGSGTTQSFPRESERGLGSSSSRKSGQSPCCPEAPQRLSQEKPLLILLENAQWMDAASFNKVKQLEEKSSGERWQLIVTAEGPLPEFWSPSLGV